MGDVGGVGGDGAGEGTPGTRICRLDDVPDGDARGFDLAGAQGAPQRLIVVRRGGEAFVYLNRCPHRGTPLDWMPDRFLDLEGRHLICSTHGALFRMEDGVCIAGPCAGDGLRVIEAAVLEGWVVVRGP